MTSYFSTGFVCVCLPLAVLAYALVPKRVRWVALLFASYLFAFILSRGLTVFIWASTLLVYGLGRAMGMVMSKRDNELQAVKKGKREIRLRYKKKLRWVLVLGIVLNVGIIVVLKYLGFFASVLGGIGLEVPFAIPQIGVPVGISFYTLMGVSYLVDIYRESTKPDAHLGHVALYLCYFPYLMEGPIVRYGQVAPRLWEGEPLREDNLYAGSLRVIVGFAKKLIVADRLNALIETVFEQYGSYDGGIIAFAAILYTMQLYCDFAGTMDVALGLSRIFGPALPENFRQPFFSRTSSEFWQRWHITLGAWFKDYVYYPVSLSKTCKSLTKRARKRFGRHIGPLLVSMIALFCVWMLNGLWHGAGSQYVAFGMFYFVVISAGGFVELAAQRAAVRFKIDRESTPYVVFRVVRTVMLVFVGELIFRATSSAAAGEMIHRMVTQFSFAQLTDGTVLSLGIDAHDLAIAAVGIALVLAVDAVKEKGVAVWDVVAGKGAVLRWALWLLLLFAVVIFGAYGHGYVPVDPMYADF